MLSGSSYKAPVASRKALSSAEPKMNLKNAPRDLLHYRNAYILAFSATAGHMCYGWDIGLIGGVLALPSFKQYFQLENESVASLAALNGNVVSILQAGGLFGALVSTWFANRYGRKPPMIIATVIFIIGSVIQSIVGLGSTPAVGLKVFNFGRFVGGVGLGVVTAIAPTYIAECAPRAIRGRCTGAIEVSVGLGNMLGFWINYGVSVQIPIGQIQWRLPIIVQIIPGILLLMFMPFQPESPRWLVEKERYDDAAKSLAYVARTDPSSPAIQATLAEIREDFAGRRQLSLWSQLRKMGESKIIAYRCFVPPFLTFLQQWSGTNAINYYSPQIFEALGISSTSTSLFATGIYGVVKYVASFLVLAFVIESWGRKRTLFYGGLAQALTMLWIGGYSAVHPQPTIVPATYVSIVAIYLYGVAFCFGWGFTPLVLGSEIAPSHLRQGVMALTMGMTWLFTYVIAQVTPRMLATIGWGTYVVFGVASVGMSVYIWLGVPETTGVPLEEVKWLFEGPGVWVRFIKDAPGGQWVLRWMRLGRAVPNIEEIKKQAEAGIVEEGMVERDELGGGDVSHDNRVDDALII